MEKEKHELKKKLISLFNPSVIIEWNKIVGSNPDFLEDALIYMETNDIDTLKQYVETAIKSTGKHP